MKKEELRNVPTKNYIILGIVLLVSLGLVYYFHLWFKAYNENELSNRIMDKYMDNINYNELDNYLVENNNSIVYVSVLNDNDIREFEKKFKTLFRKKKIIHNVLYMDVTNDMLEFNHRYSNINVPAIMIFTDGELSIAYKIDPSDYDLNEIKDYINDAFRESELND